MNDYIKLIIFNVIMIFLSFSFKKYIIIFYVFLLLFMLSYEMILKNKIIEGNFQEELFKSLDNLDYNKPTLKLPIKKMTLILEKMLEKISGGDIFKEQNKCKGEFVINKLINKTCGDGFNERVYKILDKGDGDCLHSELYKEKVPLRPCGYAEKCVKDLDCTSNRCNEGLCDFELECNETMLSGCSYDSCMALNNDLDKSLYYWHENKCQANPCNEHTYSLCDEGGCNDLSYRFKYDTETKQCKEIINEQGESNTEPTSMENTYQQYLDEGGYNNVCKDVDSDKETCEVGVDLQPRYYCKGEYVKSNDGINGDSNHCFNVDELNSLPAPAPASVEGETSMLMCKSNKGAIICPIVEFVNSEDEGRSFDRYHLKLSLQGTAKNVFVIYGNKEYPMIIPASNQVNPPYGSNYGGVQAALANYSPESVLNDSWLTINITEPDPLLIPVGIDATKFSSWNNDGDFEINGGGIIIRDPTGIDFTNIDEGIIIAQINVGLGSSWTANINAQGLNNDDTVWTIEYILFSNEMVGQEGDINTAVESPTINLDTNSPYNVCPDLDGDGSVGTGDLLAVLGSFNYVVVPVDWTSTSAAAAPAPSSSQKAASIALPIGDVDMNDLVGVLKDFHVNCSVDEQVEEPPPPGCNLVNDEDTCLGATPARSPRLVQGASCSILEWSSYGRWVKGQRDAENADDQYGCGICSNPSGLPNIEQGSNKNDLHNFCNQCCDQR